MSLLRLRLLLLLISLALVSGCGQKGPLILPPEEAPAPTSD
jgi:predicted small lipoprotein YifL